MNDIHRKFTTLGVRRWGEETTTPIVLDVRAACCERFSDHVSRGCIGLAISGQGLSGIVHLTNDEARNLADLLRAMTP